MLDDVTVNHSPAGEASAEKIEANLDEVVEVKDATGDVNEAAILPPAGFYPVKLKDSNDKGLDAKATTSKQNTPSRSYVGGQIIGEVVANGEDYDGTPIYHYINSLVRRGKPTSDLHHLLNCAQSPASNRMTVRELLAHAKDVISGSPAVYAFIDWKASYKTDKVENGYAVYDEIAKRMDQFPKHYVDANGETVSKSTAGAKWDGTYLQQLPSPKDNEPVNAQLYIRAFYTEAEAKRLMTKA